MTHRGLIQEISQKEVWKNREPVGHPCGSKWCVGLGDGRAPQSCSAGQFNSYARFLKYGVGGGAMKRVFFPSLPGGKGKESEHPSVIHSWKPKGLLFSSWP